MADLTVEEVAQELGLHYETVRRFVQHGKIPGYKAGVRQWRVTHKGLADYKAQRASTNARRCSNEASREDGKDQHGGCR